MSVEKLICLGLVVICIERALYVPNGTIYVTLSATECDADLTQQRGARRLDQQ